jgi:tetratricopeptide (TPR) repeat protein
MTLWNYSLIPSNRLRKSRLSFFFLTLLIFLLIQSSNSLQVHGQQTKSISNPEDTLELGKPIERDIAGGQTQSFRVKLSKDQFAGLSIQRRGIDVVEQLLGPDGKVYARFASEWRSNVTESVGFVAETSGVYQLDVKAPVRGSTGSYEIRIMEIRAATDPDRWLNEAHRLSTAATTISGAGKLDDAIVMETRAIELAEKASGQDDAFVGLLLNELGSLQRNKGEYPKAEATLQRALAINQKALGPDHTQTVDSLNRLGLLYRSMNDYVKAESLLRQSLEITERTLGPDNPRVVIFLDNLQTIHFDLGDLEQAERDLERALVIAAKVLDPDHPDQARLLNNLGNLYRLRGDNARAEPLL